MPLSQRLDLFFFCNRMLQAEKDREAEWRGGGQVPSPCLGPRRRSIGSSAASCRSDTGSLFHFAAFNYANTLMMLCCAVHERPQSRASSERASQHILPLFPPSHQAPPSQTTRPNSLKQNKSLSSAGGPRQAPKHLPMAAEEQPSSFSDCPEPELYDFTNAATTTTSPVHGKALRCCFPAQRPQCTHDVVPRSNRCLLSSLSPTSTTMDLPPSSQIQQKSIQHLADSAATIERPLLMLRVAVHYQLAWTSGPVHLSWSAAARVARFLQDPVSVVWAQTLRCTSHRAASYSAPPLLSFKS